MKKKNLFLGVLLASTAFSLAACGNNPPATTTSNTGDVITNTGDTTNTGETTPAVEKVTVTFNTNGGSAVSSAEINKGEKVTKPATDPTKTATADEKYTFGGWYKDAGCSEAFDFNAAINSNTTVYAKWNVVGKVSVAFNTAGGSTVDVQYVFAGEKITAPATNPTKAGTAQYTYTFGGWYKDAEYTEEFDFTAPITAETVVYAKWDATVNKYNITFNTNGAARLQPINDVEYGTKVEAPETPTPREVDGKEIIFGGWYKDAEFKKEFCFSSPVTGDLNLYAKWIEIDEGAYQGYTKIANIQDFLDFRKDPASSKDVILLDDIDLEGITLESSANYFAKTFDGNGHVIKNATYSENAANKTGILVRELKDGAVVKNVKFLSCSAIVNDETIGLVSGMCDGTIVFEKIEFNACSISANNYAGFLTGRISASGTNLTADQITTKNGCRSTLVSYGGFIIGDIAGGASATDPNVVTLTNMDLAGEIKGGNLNGSFIFGRIRNNTTCTLENSVIRDVKLTNEKSDMGLLAGGGTTNGKNVLVNIKNVAILNASSGVTTLQSLGDLMEAKSLGSGEFLTTYDLQNVYIPQGSTLSLGTKMPQVPTHNEVTALTEEATPNWLRDNVNLDFTEIWMTEGENDAKYRLTASSTNVKSPDATLETIKITTANATTRFTKGSEFSSDGLVIAAMYSDGVQLILSPEEYEIDYSAFDKDTPGEYVINVKGVEKNADGEDVESAYTVTLAEKVGFIVDTQFAKLTYTVGETLDFTNLLVYSVWSDGVVAKEVHDTDKDGKITNYKYNVDVSEYNKDVAGNYRIYVTLDDFDTQVFDVSVVGSKPIAVDGNIYINVDSMSQAEYDGALVDGVETFTTITNAINYLVSANLGDVNKVIYVADGIYHEKITIPATLTNLKIIGESMAGTIIDYDAVEGTVNPLNGSVYKMDCATLHVNATGFGLENITVQNSFDYINDNKKFGDPQGFALTIAADGAVINKVHLYGNQDTLFFKSGRAYIVDSIIEGNVDFIFGENTGLAFFDNCLINAVYRGDTNNTGYATAMKGDTGATKPTYGYIFNGCAFTADGDYTADTLPTEGPATWFSYTHNYGSSYNVNAGSMSLGRPWGGGATVSMINCSFTDAFSTLSYTTDDKTKSRWFSMSGNSPINADFSEYGSTGDGAITEAVVGGKLLSATEAENYTATNLFAKTNGGVKWNTEFDYAGELAKLKAMISKTDATEIYVTKEDVTVFEGGTVNLNTHINPWNASKKDIIVEIADAEVVSYENGIISGLKAGSNTTITLTCGSLQKVINVTVQEGVFYTVDFVTDGSAVTSQVVVEGEAIQAVETTLAGCKFMGWYKDEGYTELFDTTSAVTSKMTLYAKFVKLALYNPETEVFTGWTAYGTDGKEMAETARNYYLMFEKDGSNSTAPSAATAGAVATYKLAYGAYLQGNVEGYTNKVNVNLRGSTTSTGNGIILNVVAYDAKGNVLKTETVDVFAKTKVTDEASFTIESDTANIAYVRISTGTSGKNIGVVYAEMTYERNYTAEKSYSIQFGANGNYSEFINDSVTVSDHASEPTSQVNGTIELNVKAGGTVVVTGYPGVYEYSIQVGDAAPVAATAECSYVTVTEDTVVKVASTKYLYEIAVIYPIDKDASFTYGDSTLTTGNGLSFVAVKDKTVGTSSGSSYQFKSDTRNAAVFSVAKDCTVTIQGHDKTYGLLKIYVNGVLSTATIDDNGNYTIAAKGNDVIVVKGDSSDLSHSYIKGIIVDYA